MAQRLINKLARILSLKKKKRKKKFKMLNFLNFKVVKTKEATPVKDYRLIVE